MVFEEQDKSAEEEVMLVALSVSSLSESELLDSFWLAHGSIISGMVNALFGVVSQVSFSCTGPLSLQLPLSQQLPDDLRPISVLLNSDRSTSISLLLLR